MEGLVGGLHGSAGGPDVVKEEIGGVFTDFGVFSEGVGRGGLGLAGLGVGANLDGVMGAGKEFLDGVIRVEVGKVFSDEIGVVEAAFANVFGNSGEGDDDGLFLGRGEDLG